MAFEFLKWLGHASFLLEVKKKNVYIDPFRLTTVKEKADTILITHPHFDHCSSEDIEKIATEKTEIFVPKDSVGKIKVGKVTGVEPGSSYSSNGIRFSTMPAYNTSKERLSYHPKASDWVGYIVEAEKSVFHAGDTDFIEEMREVKADLALLPMGGTYTMSLDEAIEAAASIDAKNVAPMHYKALLGKEGSANAEKEFSARVKNSIIFNEAQKPYYSF